MATIGKSTIEKVIKADLFLAPPINDQHSAWVFNTETTENSLQIINATAHWPKILPWLVSY